MLVYNLHILMAIMLWPETLAIMIAQDDAYLISEQQIICNYLYFKGIY